MFAARRTPSVTGRIHTLATSTTTINGTSHTGVPVGTKCAKAFREALAHCKEMIPAHKTSLRVAVAATCAVGVNT